MARIKTSQRVLTCCRVGRATKTGRAPPQPMHPNARVALRAKSRPRPALLVDVSRTTWPTPPPTVCERVAQSSQTVAATGSHGECPWRLAALRALGRAWVVASRRLAFCTPKSRVQGPESSKQSLGRRVGSRTPTPAGHDSGSAAAQARGISLHGGPDGPEAGGPRPAKEPDAVLTRIPLGPKPAGLQRPHPTSGAAPHLQRHYSPVL